MIDSNQDEAVKLEACPFCGGKARDYPDCRTISGFEVSCTSCGAATHESDPQRARLHWNTRIPPANLNAPDKQEALAGEGVERSDGIRAADRICTVCDAVVAAYPQGMCCHCQELPWPVDPARTLPSNEALAGDDRNGVEVVSRLTELARKMQERYAVEPLATFGLPDIDVVLDAAVALATLSRTPSSPQADVADVERVARLVEPGTWEAIDAAARGGPPAAPGAGLSSLQIARKILAAMTTRPAGGEEVEKLLGEFEWGLLGLEGTRVSRKKATDLLSRINAIRAALTRPAALPKEREEAIRARAFEEAARVAEEYQGSGPDEAAEGAAWAWAAKALIAQRIRTLSSLPVRSGEVEQIVAWLRAESDKGADKGIAAEKGTTKRAAYGGGSYALSLAADAIARREYRVVAPVQGDGK